MIYAVPAINSAYSSGSAPMSRSSARGRGSRQTPRTLPLDWPDYAGIVGDPADRGPALTR